jgi:hypothetical protein
MERLLLLRSHVDVVNIDIAAGEPEGCGEKRVGERVPHAREYEAGCKKFHGILRLTPSRLPAPFIP